MTIESIGFNSFMSPPVVCHCRNYTSTFFELAMLENLRLAVKI